MWPKTINACEEDADEPGNRSGLLSDTAGGARNGGEVPEW